MKVMVMMFNEGPVTDSTLWKSFVCTVCLSITYKQLLSNKESLLIKLFDLLAVIRIGGNFMGVGGVDWGDGRYHGSSLEYHILR